MGEARRVKTKKGAQVGDRLIQITDVVSPDPMFPGLAPEATTDEKCDQCGAPMLVKRGRFGPHNPPCPAFRPSGTTTLPEMRGAHPRNGTCWMKNFLRGLRWTWPYRGRIALSIVFAFLAALLWSLVTAERFDSVEMALGPMVAEVHRSVEAAHDRSGVVRVGGGAGTERAETFPYVFWKPPSTTLVDPYKPVVIPKVSPDHIDWELELCIVIGRRARHVSEAEALNYVAGYTVANDISDRQYRPNPDRKPRGNDKWFDWEHGKWHDTFCPCGPCIASADAIPDPQKLKMKLTVSGSVKQNATTGQQIFPVAAVVAFVSDILTLEPGDLISTGTPGGVGNTTGTYLKPGDRIEAWIEGIGTLVSPVKAE
jgi:2-keto-4-pentenoate hydratase/2-oxohepta-3-ene-1,7-dioic acid hydratase in catechol pathway